MRGRQTLGGYEVMGSCYVMFIRFGRRPPFFFFFGFYTFFFLRAPSIWDSFFLSGDVEGKGGVCCCTKSDGGCEGYVLIFFLHDRWGDGKLGGVTILVYTFCYCWGEILILGITICWGVMDGFREGRELLSWRGFWG